MLRVCLARQPGQAVIVSAVVQRAQTNAPRRCDIRSLLAFFAIVTRTSTRTIFST